MSSQIEVCSGMQICSNNEICRADTLPSFCDEMKTRKKKNHYLEVVLELLRTVFEITDW